MPKTNVIEFSNKRKPTKEVAKRRRRVAGATAGAVALSAYVAANPGQVANSIKTFPDFIGGQFTEHHIPGPDDPYRSVRIGEMVSFTVGGRRLRMELRDPASIVAAVEKANPNTQPEDIIQLVSSETMNHQKAVGSSGNKLSPNVWKEGDQYRLPAEWGIGTPHGPDSNGPPHG